MAAQPPPKRQQVRSFLLNAFAISIALHVLFGPFIAHWKAPDTEKEQVQKVAITKQIKVVVPTPPPPTPKPTPTPPPPKVTPTPHQVTQAKKLKVNIPKTKSVSASGPSENTVQQSQGDENGAPQGQATAGSGTAAGPTGPPATPAPTPVPTPACAHPQVPPATITAVAPDVPEIARQQGIQGRVQVRVDLNEQSKIVGVSIYSSPNPLLNKAAMDAARQSTFRTEVQNCQPIASSYLYIVDFQSQ